MRLGEGQTIYIVMREFKMYYTAVGTQVLRHSAVEGTSSGPFEEIYKIESLTTQSYTCIKQCRCARSLLGRPIFQGRDRGAARR